MSASAPPPMDVLSGVKEIVAVHSAKGGVGKSTLAANLAVTLARRGLVVGLLDADVHGPSIAHMFGDDSMPEPSFRPGMALPLIRHGVKYLSIANAAGDDAPIIWRGPMVSQAIGQLLGGVDWGALDLLILDMPPGTGDAILGVGQTITLSGVVSVTTPSTLSVTDTRRGMQGFGQLSIPILGLVENMAALVCDECGERAEIFGESVGQDTADELGIPLLGELPIDPALVAGGDAGVPTAAADPEGATAQAFDKIADSLLEALAIHGRAATASFEVIWQGLPADTFRPDPPQALAAPTGEVGRGGEGQQVDLPLAVWQAANDALGIRWADGESSFHGAYELRMACPCAACVEEWSREKLPSLDDVPRNVKPVRISTVGRYALQPAWSDDHHTGIYSFRDLRAGAGRIDPR